MKSPRLVESHWDSEDEFVNISIKPRPLATASSMLSKYFVLLFTVGVLALGVIFYYNPEARILCLKAVRHVLNNEIFRANGAQSSNNGDNESNGRRREARGKEGIAVDTSRIKSKATGKSSSKVTPPPLELEKPDNPDLLNNMELCASTTYGRVSTSGSDQTIGPANIQEETKNFARQVLLAKQSFREQGLDESNAEAFVLGQYQTQRQIDFLRSEKQRDRVYDSRKFAVKIQLEHQRSQDSLRQHEELLVAKQYDKDWLQKLSSGEYFFRYEYVRFCLASTQLLQHRTGQEQRTAALFVQLYPTLYWIEDINRDLFSRGSHRNIGKWI